MAPDSSNQLRRHNGPICRRGLTVRRFGVEVTVAVSASVQVELNSNGIKAFPGVKSSTPSFTGAIAPIKRRFSHANCPDRGETVGSDPKAHASCSGATITPGFRIASATLLRYIPLYDCVKYLPTQAIGISGRSLSPSSSISSRDRPCKHVGDTCWCEADVPGHARC